MSFTFEVEERTADKMPFIIIHGGPGVGKSTLASKAPDPIFIQTEDAGGELRLKTLKKGIFTSYEEIMAALRYLYSNHDKYKSFVIDSLDHLEPLVLEYTLRTNEWNHISEGAYGAGYAKLDENWRSIIEAIKKIVHDKKKIFIGIAHSVVRSVNDPTVEPYDAHEMKLNKRVLPLIRENADVIGFINSPIIIDSKSGRAKGGSSIVMNTRPNAGYEAKTRYSSMPTKIPLTRDDGWTNFAKHIPTVAALMGVTETSQQDKPEVTEQSEQAEGK